jgi:Flp pilus assembly protein TadD
VFKEVRLRPAVGTTTTGSAAALVGVGELNIPADARQAFAEGDSALARLDFREARKRFEKAVRVYPQYAAAYNNLGAALMQLGEREQGRKAFEKAISLDVHLPGAYLNLAKVVVSEEKYGDAEALLNKSLAAEPNSPEALSLLALSQLMTGKLEAAVASARRVHALAPHERFAVVHFIAARALERRQQVGEAIAEYKTFLQESPDSPNAARAREALNSLQDRKQ